MADTIKFNLIGNAQDSLEYAIDLLAYDLELTPSIRYKRAIQSISHDIELILKERLRRIHPSLVWENVEKYPNLDSRTVTVDGAINRLVNIGGLVFHENDLKLLRSIKKTRNAIEHYTWNMETKEAEFIASQSLAFAMSFMKDKLQYDLLGYSEKRGGTLSDLLANNRSFSIAFEKRNTLEEQESLGAIKVCSFCKALMDKNDDGVCPKCGHWDSENYINTENWFDDIPF
jgi:hypothetical protein